MAVSNRAFLTVKNLILENDTQELKAYLESTCSYSYAGGGEDLIETTFQLIIAENKEINNKGERSELAKMLMEVSKDIHPDFFLEKEFFLKRKQESVSSRPLMTIANLILDDGIHELKSHLEATCSYLSSEEAKYIIEGTFQLIAARKKETNSKDEMSDLTKMLLEVSKDIHPDFFLKKEQEGKSLKRRKRQKNLKKKHDDLRVDHVEDLERALIRVNKNVVEETNDIGVFFRMMSDPCAAQIIASELIGSGVKLDILKEIVDSVSSIYRARGKLSSNYFEKTICNHLIDEAVYLENIPPARKGYYVR